MRGRCQRLRSTAPCPPRTSSPARAPHSGPAGGWRLFPYRRRTGVRLSSRGHPWERGQGEGSVGVFPATEEESGLKSGFGAERSVCAPEPGKGREVWLPEARVSLLLRGRKNKRNPQMWSPCSGSGTGLRLPLPEVPLLPLRLCSPGSASLSTRVGRHWSPDGSPAWPNGLQPLAAGLSPATGPGSRASPTGACFVVGPGGLHSCPPWASLPGASTSQGLGPGQVWPPPGPVALDLEDPDLL